MWISPFGWKGGNAAELLKHGWGSKHTLQTSAAGESTTRLDADCKQGCWPCVHGCQNCGWVCSSSACRQLCRSIYLISQDKTCALLGCKCVFLFSRKMGRSLPGNDARGLCSFSLGINRPLRTSEGWKKSFYFKHMNIKKFDAINIL